MRGSKGPWRDGRERRHRRSETHLAAERGDLELVQLLVEAGADPNALDHKRKTEEVLFLELPPGAQPVSEHGLREAVLGTVDWQERRRWDGLRAQWTRWG
jgi:Ankyrin repeat